MSNTQYKRDRTARLLKMEIILWQHPNGLTVKQIAQNCAISLRTAYRDLQALESELGVPIWEKDDKRGIVDGYFLPSVTFSLGDAINIFLATRLIQSYFLNYSQSIISTFLKLNMMMPSPLKQQLQGIIDCTRDQFKYSSRVGSNFTKLIQAWLTHHQTTIFYQELTGEEARSSIIEPYFFEPGWGQTYYVIAYSHLHGEVRSFNIQQIVNEVSVSSNTYEIPSSFNIIEYLKYSWCAMTEGDTLAVKLLFKPGISKALKNIYFHPSQHNEVLADGSLLVKMTVRNTRDFLAFVLGWLDSVEVLEPELLRSQLISTINRISDLYKKAVPNTELELNNDQWKLILPIISGSTQKGRPISDARKTLNGILWVLRNNRRWEDIPLKYGSRSTCNYRYLVWKKSGLWDKIVQTLYFDLEKRCTSNYR